MNDILPRLRGRWWMLAGFVCLFSTLPYFRAFELPEISDTYLQVWLGRKYFHFTTWPDLALDALYRCRATSIWITGWIDALFGSHVLILRLQSIFIHVLNVGLIAAFGRFPAIGYRISLLTAFFWGLNERHHEAVLWYASLPEQLVFFFVLLSLFCWLLWWSSRRPLFYFATVATFILALLSKESAVIACVLFATPLLYQPRHLRRTLLEIAPFLVLSALYFGLNFAARRNHLHWNDGTFQLGWHFIPVLFNSGARLLSFWGLASIAILLAMRKRVPWRLAAVALLWIPVALAPYSFVAYQLRVPSRHAYLASLGAALLLALATHRLFSRPRLVLALLLCYLTFNTGYVWFYKHQQFLTRAAVTESLVDQARALLLREGIRPLQVHCFALDPELAVLAISERLHIAPQWVSVASNSNPPCGPAVVDVILD